MKHPLAWDPEPLNPEILEPFSMCVIEGAASFFPAIVEEDLVIGACAVNFFLEEQTQWAANRVIEVRELRNDLSIPSPIRFKTDFVIAYDTNFDKPELRPSTSPKLASVGWLLGAHDGNALAEIFDYVREQPNFEDFVECPENLDLGVWLEISTRPPIPGSLAPFTPLVLAQVPGTQLYKFLPKGAESS